MLERLLKARAKFWNVAATGNYGEDCRAGDVLAQDLIDEIRRTHNPSLLVWVVRDMKAVSVFTGVEIGFLAGVAHRAASLPQYDTLDAGVQGGVVDPEDGVGTSAVCC